MKDRPAREVQIGDEIFHANKWKRVSNTQREPIRRTITIWVRNCADPIGTFSLDDGFPIRRE